ncbi:MAG: hypothetical protein K9I94_01360 [Bacteroidales bacterium]|nr:hypothetical protein [Bacteroidales bacterium]
MGELIMFHSLWRWIVVLLIFITMVVSLIQWVRKSDWTKGNRVTPLISSIVLDINVLVGLILYVMEKRWLGGDHFISYLHPLLMLAALAAIHISYAKAKNKTSFRGHKIIAIGFLIVIFLLLSGIPHGSWSFGM